MVVKETGRVAAVAAAVAGAFLAASSLHGLVDQRNHLRSQVAAMPHPTAPSTSVPPPVSAAPHRVTSPHNDVQAPTVPFLAGQLGGALIVQPVTRVTVAPATPGMPQPGPSPTPHPRCRPAVVTAQVPLGVLPCSTLTAGRLARIGGTS